MVYIVFTDSKNEIMNDTSGADTGDGGGDYFNYTNESTIWSNDNGTALSEEERLLRLQLNSSFGAWLVFMEMSLGQKIYQESVQRRLWLTRKYL